MPPKPHTFHALIGRCPNCGKGKLFAGYLKQVENCAVCGERFGHIRADDGPTWLTLLLVGHILAPFMLIFIPETDWPEWLIITFWCAWALILSLLILPRAKGLFIAVLWRMHHKKPN